MRLCLSRCRLERASACGPVFIAVRNRKDANGLVACHGVLRRAEVCRRCSHFVDAARCIFLDDDPVQEIMTFARDLVIVDEGEPVATARGRGAGPIVVSAGGEAVGALTMRALAGGRASQPVRARLAGPAGVVPRTARLGAVARIMEERGLEAMLVADGDDLAGVLTRDDLRRCGLS